MAGQDREVLRLTRENERLEAVRRAAGSERDPSETARLVVSEWEGGARFVWLSG